PFRDPLPPTSHSLLNPRGNCPVASKSPAAAIGHEGTTPLNSSRSVKSSSSGKPRPAVWTAAMSPR
ncbi:unnamed protein product, partial [Lampetra fluviatilis]